MGQIMDFWFWQRLCRARPVLLVLERMQKKIAASATGDILSPPGMQNGNSGLGEMKGNIMQPICDICGEHIAHADVNTISAIFVVKATSAGYLPSKMPTVWTTRYETLGISLADHWAMVVKMNSSADWGLCKDCLTELESFPVPIEVTGEIFATALGYCAHCKLLEVPFVDDEMIDILKTLSLNCGLSEDQINGIVVDAILGSGKTMDELRSPKTIKEMGDFIFRASTKERVALASHPIHPGEKTNPMTVTAASVQVNPVTDSVARVQPDPITNSAGSRKPWWQFFMK
jgi:hypothetical protein